MLSDARSLRAARRQSSPRRPLCRAVQPAALQALDGSDQRRTVAVARPHRSCLIEPGQAKNAAPPRVLLLLPAVALAFCFYEHLHPFACSDANGICSKGVRVEGRNWVAIGRQAKVGQWQLLAPTSWELAIPLPATGRP